MLTATEEQKFKTFVLDYLNSFEDDPELKLDADFWEDMTITVHADVNVHGMYRILLIQVDGDDGGPSFFHMSTSADLDYIDFADHWFDTTTAVMKHEPFASHSSPFNPKAV
jgi:hypothetical protein